LRDVWEKAADAGNADAYIDWIHLYFDPPTTRGSTNELTMNSSDRDTKS
jgi:hypothetical protein